LTAAEPHALLLHDALPILFQLLPRRRRVRLAARALSDLSHRLLVDGDRRLLAFDLHHAERRSEGDRVDRDTGVAGRADALLDAPDRKSTRLNSSHVKISYA